MKDPSIDDRLGASYRFTQKHRTHTHTHTHTHKHVDTRTDGRTGRADGPADGVEDLPIPKKHCKRTPKVVGLNDPKLKAYGLGGAQERPKHPSGYRVA